MMVFYLAIFLVSMIVSGVVTYAVIRFFWWLR